jgi:hypothetical protein
MDRFLSGAQKPPVIQQTFNIGQVNNYVSDRAAGIRNKTSTAATTIPLQLNHAINSVSIPSQHRPAMIGSIIPQRE